MGKVELVSSIHKASLSSPSISLLGGYWGSLVTKDDL